MKKIIFLLIIPAFFAIQKSSAQGTMISTQFSVLSLTEDTMTIFVDTWFSIGYEATCPEMSDYTIERRGDSLTLQLYYDVSGAWPMAGCEQKDTLNIGINKTISTISIFSNSIDYYRDTADHNGQDTVLISDTTLSNPNSTGISTGNKLDRYIKVVPNPVSDYLYLETKDFVLIKDLIITDVQGRVLQSYPNWNGGRINIQRLTAGIYFLKIQVKDGRQGTFKVLKI